MIGPPRDSCSRLKGPALVLLAVIGGIAATVISLGAGRAGTNYVVRQPPGYTARATPVPRNRVSGQGSATVRLDGDVATVTLRTSGLLNGLPHAMHIHAGGRGVCPPASAARLHNGHLSISTADGIKFYGPPVTSLTISGDTTAASKVDFSRYPSVGDIAYRRTLTLPHGIADAVRAGNAVIVVHGIDYNGNAIYDGVLGRSDLDSSLPGEATAPAVCGPLTAPATSARADARGAVFMASLLVESGAGVGQPVERRMVCTVPGRRA